MIGVEIEQKLTYPHPTIQRQGVQQLYQKVVEFSNKHGEKLTTLNKECPSLVYICEHLGHTDDLLDRQFCKCLFDLVRGGKVHQDLVYTSCITASALQRCQQNTASLVLKLRTTYPREVPNIDPLVQMFLNNKQQAGALYQQITSFFLLQIQNHKTKLPLTVVDSFIRHVLSDDVECSRLVDNLLRLVDILHPQHPSHAINIYLYTLNLYKEQKNSNALISIDLTNWAILHIQHIDLESVHQLVWMLVTPLNKQAQRHMCYQSLYLIRTLTDIIHQTNVSNEEKYEFEEELLYFCVKMLLNETDDTIILELLTLVNRLSSNVSDVSYILPVYVLPLLHILSSQHNNHVHRMASAVFQNVQRSISPSRTAISKPVSTEFPFGDVFKEYHLSLSLLHEILRDEEYARSWLIDTQFSIEKRKQLPDDAILVLSAIMVRHTTKEIVEQSMETVVSVCNHDHEHVLTIFPLLVYLLKCGKSSKLRIMFVFPKLVLHKMLIGVILKVVMSFSSNPQLMPVTLKLMTQMFYSQPRVFPHLAALLHKQADRSTTPKQVWYEWMLAKAVTVYNIIKHGGNHGKDMVVVLSKLLDELTEEQTSMVVQNSACLSLVVESIKLLCLQKVIDMDSIWKVVAMKVQANKTVLVSRSLCSLLACVPQVSSVNKTLNEEAIIYLWFIVKGTKEHEVVSAAYEALTEFKSEDMKVKYLPEQVRDEVCDWQMKENKNLEDYQPLEETCPGFAYICLLQHANEQLLKLPGLQLFLSSILKQELENLPRGISKVRVTSSTVTSSLCNLLHTQYQQLKKPGVLPGIAAGLLCCFTLQEQQQAPGERYTYLLSSLLNDFSVQQNDWHHALTAPRQWKQFLTNLFRACVQGETALIEKRKEEFMDTESYNEALNSVHHVVRDRITDQLRKASRGNPRSQGNSIMALVGLASAVYDCEEVEVDKRYISMRQWLLAVVDTVLVIFDGNHKPRSKPFQWCQQVSSGKSSASSLLSRSCAALCMHGLVHILVSLDGERITQMLQMLIERCPLQSKTGSSSSLQLHCGIGLGMVLSRLYQHLQVLPSECNTLLQTTFTSLEGVVYTEDADATEGAVVGYAVAIAARFETHMFDRSAFDRLFAMCNARPDEELQTLRGQTLYFALAASVQNAFQTEKLTTDDLISVVELIKKKTEVFQSSDLHISLGMLVHTLLQANIKRDLTDNIFAKWNDHLADENSTVIQELASVKGLVSALGVNSLVFGGNTQVNANLRPASIKTLKRVYQTSNDNSVCLLLARFFGELSILDDQQGDSNLPDDYSYLKPTSLLRHVFHALKTRQKNTMEGETLLNALCVCEKLPPVNWATLFDALVKESLKEACIGFALQHCKTSTCLALWLSSFLNISAFDSRLSIKMRSKIIAETADILPCLSNSLQKYLLEDLPLYCIAHALLPPKSIFQQWLSVAVMTSPLQSTIAYVTSAVTKFLETSEECQEVILSNINLISKLVYKLFGANWKGAINNVNEKLWLALYTNALSEFQFSPNDVIFFLDRAKVADMNAFYSVVHLIDKQLDESFLSKLHAKLTKSLKSDERSEILLKMFSGTRTFSQQILYNGPFASRYICSKC